MKKIKPWRYLLGLGLPTLLLAGFWLESSYSNRQNSSEVQIYNIGVVSEDSGPVVKFDVVNFSDQEKTVDQLNVNISNLLGSEQDSLKIEQPMLIEANKKRTYRLEWAEGLNIKGWMWAKVGLEGEQEYKKLAWYLPRVGWSSPASIAAGFPILGYFVVRKTFFT